MIETLAHGYSSESTPRELSNEYQHDRVKMFFKNLCVLVLWTKVASALEGLKHQSEYSGKVPVSGTRNLIGYYFKYNSQSQHSLQTKNKRSQ